MKVYVVTGVVTDYLDDDRRDVGAVFTSRDDAARFADSVGGKIDEMELDPPVQS